MMQKMSSYYRPTNHRSFISSPDWAVMLQQQGYQGPKLQPIKNDNGFTHYNTQSQNALAIPTPILSPPPKNEATKMPAPTTEKFKNRYTCT